MEGNQSAMRRHYRTLPRKIPAPVATSRPQLDIADHSLKTTHSSENGITVLHSTEGMGRGTQTHQWVAIYSPVCKLSFQPLHKACMVYPVFLPHFNFLGRRLALSGLLGSPWEENGNCLLSPGFAWSCPLSRPLGLTSYSTRSTCPTFLKIGRIGWVQSSWAPMPHNQQNCLDPSSQSISKVCHHLFAWLVGQSWNRYGVALVRQVWLACCSVSFGKLSRQWMERKY